MKKFFIFSMVLVGIASLLYAAWLVRLMDSNRYPVFYIYLRFFLVGWVISSIIIALIGDTKQIGGMKSFLISLLNPALGIIMVLASENKTDKHLVNTIHHKHTHPAPKNNTIVNVKRSSYTLNM